ncbi:hypothetical protein TNCV_338331 [Trichonephila clavipes]|nr:hypothetical protein TNCV_3364881 [Trichonephila clavipes]GFX50298.1 hypothetical protein TNCV_338331 [Trichonephila clavipes]
MPNIIDSHDMGLRTVLQSRRPKVNAYSRNVSRSIFPATTSDQRPSRRCSWGMLNGAPSPLGALISYLVVVVHEFENLPFLFHGNEGFLKLL